MDTATKGPITKIENDVRAWAEELGLRLDQSEIAELSWHLIELRLREMLTPVKAEGK